MEGLIIVGLIGFFAFWGPESDKKLSRSKQREIKAELMERSPDSTKKVGEKKSTDSSN